MSISFSPPIPPITISFLSYVQNARISNITYKKRIEFSRKKATRKLCVERRIFILIEFFLPRGNDLTVKTDSHL